MKISPGRMDMTKYSMDHMLRTGALAALFSLCLNVGAADKPAFANAFDETPAEHQECMKLVYSRKDPRDPDWVHMHHYCQGLRFYQRAQRTRNDDAQFRHNLANSIDGYDYVLRQTKKTFRMRPEVLVMRGRTLELMSQDKEAAMQYFEALELDANFSMAYGALGNLLARQGQKSEALKILGEGLRRKPNNRYLQARYAAISGGALPPRASTTAPAAESAGEKSDTP